MRAAVNACHPSIWKFIEVIQHDHALCNVVIAQAVGGHTPEPRRKKYVQCEKRITNIVKDFETREMIDFLRAIAYNLKM